tara:strand:+ start:206389 stop:207108 length:720 start_codon:yes stop_codon:yes gene_type:complete
MFIHQAATRALGELGSPTHVTKLCRYIVDRGYYDFGAKDPENALAIQLSRRSCNVAIGKSSPEKVFYRAAPATYGLNEWLEIGDGTENLSNDPSEVELDVVAILQRGAAITEQERLLLARIGQGTFRSSVLGLWNNRCAITGASLAIRASHIKPWRRSNSSERLDPNNGLPLVATLDALFDSHLISFENNGHIIFGSKIPEFDRQCLGIDKKMKLRRRPSEETQRYLTEHRERLDASCA